MDRAARGLGLATVILVGALLLAGCPFFGTVPGFPINVAAGLQAEWLVTNAAQPAGLAFAPDGRVFYTEKQTGRIRIIENGQLLDEPLADVPVNYAGQRGLLGIALHPNFNILPRVYVFYTRSDTGADTANPVAVVDHRVVYFVADGNQAAGGEVFVASVPADGNGARVGGRIAFAPDLTLHVALGDLGLPDAAQDPASLLGKVLRYNADGTIPADNPSADSPVCAWGFRQPAGIAFDPASGVGFVTDRNELGDDELNRVVAGHDYGWPFVTGGATTPEELDYAAQNPAYTDPILVTAAGESPIVGAAFNPGTKYGPDTRLNFFFGVEGAGRVLSAQLNDERVAVVTYGAFAARFPTPMTDVAFTPFGTLYAASQGSIVRVVRFAP